MTPNVTDIQYDELIINCDEEIQLQELLFEQLFSDAFQASENVRDKIGLDSEYEECAAEYDMLLTAIEEAVKTQEILKNEIAEIKEELVNSSYIEDIKSHKMLEFLLEQKSRKLYSSFARKMSKEQMEKFQEQREQLEKERKNSFRLQKLIHELESAKLENRELVAIKEQKMKRHDNLKKTYDEVMARREELLTKKDSLEKELEELEKESTTSYDESSEDDINIIL